MAFVCTVSQVDLAAEIHERGQASLSIVPVGFDDSESAVYSMVVGLEPLPGSDFELFFHLIASNTKTKEIIEYWSGRDTGFITETTDRQAILKAVLSLIQRLLRSAQPETVRWFTKDENPPSKALIKHLLIVNVFDANGYAVTTADPWHGHHMWLAERRNK